MDLLFLLRHWTVIILAASSRSQAVPTVRRVTVIEGTQIILRCTVPNSNPTKSKWEFRFPTNGPASDFDFTWMFRDKMIVDARCRVLDKKDVYSVVHTKGFSCHLKVLTPATFENVGMYESKHCGMFDVTVVSDSPICDFELLKEESRVEYLEKFRELLDVRRRLRCGSVEDATAATADANDSQAITGVDVKTKMKAWDISFEDLTEDELNKSSVFKINCSVRYYYVPSPIVSILSDACYDLWEFIIFGFVISTITISVMVTMFSRCTPVGEESLFEDSDSMLDLQAKSSRKATMTSEGSHKKTIVDTPTIMPRWKTWIVRPSLITQPVPVNFKQVMRDLKVSMRHMPPGGKGMMALNSASNSDDLSWYFKPN